MSQTWPVSFGGICMKNLFLASIAATGLLTTGSANAADLGLRPTYKAPPPAMAPVPYVSWTGCYLGANVGGAWANKSFSFNDEGTIVDEGSHRASGIAGGGQIGCDYQFASSWVIGIQGMFDGADLTGSNILPNDTSGTFSTKVRWFGSVTGRRGFLVGPSFLIYGKGGVAFVGDNHSFATTGVCCGPRSTGDFARTGWDAGVGVEWMFAPSWSVW